MCGEAPRRRSRRSGSRGGDGDARGLAALGRGHADLENAVPVSRRDGLGVDRTRELHAALEAAIAHLTIEVASLVLLVLRLALALDGQAIAGYGDVDGLGVDSRQVRGDDQLAVPDLRVDGGHEQPTRRHRIPRLAAF